MPQVRLPIVSTFALALSTTTTRTAASVYIPLTAAPLRIVSISAALISGTPAAPDTGGKITVLSCAFIVGMQNSPTQFIADFDVVPTMPDVRQVIPASTVGPTQICLASHAGIRPATYESGMMSATGVLVNGIIISIQAIVQNTDGAAAHNFTISGICVYEQ